MAQKRIIADQINTNVANGLLEINGSGKVDTSFLETNVANGVAGLDGSTKLATSLLETNVANGVAGLNASAEIDTSLLETNVANGVAQLDGSALLPFSSLPTGLFSGLVHDDALSVSGGTLPATDFDLSPNTTLFDVEVGDIVIAVARLFGFINRPHGDANPYIQVDNLVGSAGVVGVTADFSGRTQVAENVPANADGSGRSEIMLASYWILEVTSAGTLGARALAGNWSGDTVSYNTGGIQAYLAILQRTT